MYMYTSINMINKINDPERPWTLNLFVVYDENVRPYYKGKRSCDYLNLKDSKHIVEKTKIRTQMNHLQPLCHDNCPNKSMNCIMTDIVTLRLDIRKILKTCKNSMTDTLIYYVLSIFYLTIKCTIDDSISRLVVRIMSYMYLLLNMVFHMRDDHDEKSNVYEMSKFRDKITIKKQKKHTDIKYERYPSICNSYIQKFLNFPFMFFMTKMASSVLKFDISRTISGSRKVPTAQPQKRYGVTSGMSPKQFFVHEKRAFKARLMTQWKGLIRINVVLISALGKNHILYRFSEYKGTKIQMTDVFILKIFNHHDLFIYSGAINNQSKWPLPLFIH